MEIKGFWAEAAAAPDQPAVIDEAGSVTTFGELGNRVDRLSRGMRARGIGVGDTVAVLLPNGVDLLALQFAALQIGAYFTPVNRHLTGGETAYILGDSEARLFVADAHYAQAAREAVTTVGLPADARLSCGPIDGFGDLAALEAGPAVPVEDRTAGSMLLYSSGTTGRPKGIRKPLSGLCPEEDWQPAVAGMAAMFGLTPRAGVVLTAGPLYHAAPNQFTTVGLHLGHPVVLCRKFDAAQSLALIERHKVSWGFMVPTMFQRMLALPGQQRDAYDLSSLRAVAHAGAPCSAATKQAMHDWMGPVVFEFYGASESGTATLARPEDWLEHPGTVGRAVPGMDVRIRDDDGTELPPGEPGLIHISGGPRFDYHGDPRKTVASWRGDYFIPGDIGYLDKDGWLYLCDRRTDMIVSGGVNIYPAEVEGELLQHPAVADAVVIGVPDEEWGQRVVALVALEPGTTPTQEELVTHCRSRLAGYKCPRQVVFRDRLPRNQAGKINRIRVRDAYLASLG
ncbi:AMP-binding protein [Peterkaempfera sp. SMS 1(5)a]|uniref:AMP-binding protein n=1 Tax=Peterkaempfera podocarpi TaxID=3232308 RepID=UPI00366A7BFA